MRCLLFSWRRSLTFFFKLLGVKKLEQNGFQALKYSAAFTGQLQAGGQYYYTVHHSTLVAFTVGKKYHPGHGGFHIVGGEFPNRNIGIFLFWWAAWHGIEFFLVELKFDAFGALEPSFDISFVVVDFWPPAPFYCHFPHVNPCRSHGFSQSQSQAAFLEASEEWMCDAGRGMLWRWPLAYMVWSVRLVSFLMLAFVFGTWWNESLTLLGFMSASIDFYTIHWYWNIIYNNNNNNNNLQRLGH